jgi:hypothetical protein
VALRYRVYSNGGAGGPVDYGTPVADVAGPPYVTAVLGFSSDYTFAVRAYDDVSGLEERNLTARVRVVTGPAGGDLTGLPRPPHALQARAFGAATAAVDWYALPPGPYGTPAGFRVYKGTPSVDYTAPALTQANDGRSAYRVLVGGLTAGLTYRFAVRAYNAAGEESNTASVALAVPAAAPAAPQAGGSAAVPGSGPPGPPPSPP